MSLTLSNLRLNSVVLDHTEQASFSQDGIVFTVINFTIQNLQECITAGKHML